MFFSDFIFGQDLRDVRSAWNDIHSLFAPCHFTFRHSKIDNSDRTAAIRRIPLPPPRDEPLGRLIGPDDNTLFHGHKLTEELIKEKSFAAALILHGAAKL